MKKEFLKQIKKNILLIQKAIIKKLFLKKEVLKIKKLNLLIILEKEEYINK